MAYDNDTLKQLGNPSGDIGRKVLTHLNRVNTGINTATFHSLSPMAGDTILEIGFGGGALLEMLVTKSDGVRAVGADISELAVAEAQELYRELIDQGLLQFVATIGSVLPLAPATFDKLCCVNVIYFWQDPLQEVDEMFRVLKTAGRAVLSYAHGSPDQETKFPTSKVEDWLASAGFVEIEHQQREDQENGVYYVTTARKGGA